MQCSTQASGFQTKHVYLLQFDKVVSKISTLTSGKRTRRRSTKDLISASPKGGKCSIQFAHKRFSIASLLCNERLIATHGKNAPSSATLFVSVKFYPNLEP
jgi:hypothetical protein